MKVTLEFESNDEKRQAHIINEQLNEIYPEYVIVVQKRIQDPELWEDE